MKKLKAHIRDFFGFSKAQTNGFVGLILISTFVLFSNPLYKALVPNHPRDFSNEKILLDSIVAQSKIQLVNIDSSGINHKQVAAMFRFNPNNVTLVELDSLGFSKQLAKRLINYRTKVEAFRTKSDVGKLYGMDSLFYARLYTYIQLPEKIVEEEKQAKVFFRKEAISFDLNLADTTEFKSIFGIGTVLAKRIVKYREALGGFVSKQQLKEIYGIDSVVVERLEKTSFLEVDFLPKKLNINQLDERALSSHPYFSKKMARIIVTYRFQHGNYASVDDLRKIETLEKGTLDKVFPYLTVE